MKKLLLTGLFVLSLSVFGVERGHAGGFFSTNSTATVISSGTPFNITGVSYSTTAASSINTHYFVLIDTDGFFLHNGVSDAVNFTVCETTFAVSKRILSPTFFISSQTVIADGTIVGPTRPGWIEFPGAGVTVESGLVICQRGTPSGATTGGQVTIYTEPAGSSARNQPW